MNTHPQYHHNESVLDFIKLEMRRVNCRNYQPEKTKQTYRRRLQFRLMARQYQRPAKFWLN